MDHRLSTCLALSLLIAACAAPGGGFGDPRDAGDTGIDAELVPDADAALPLADVGEPCATPSDCADGALCIGTVAGGFECMARCGAAYTLCDDGRVCLPVMTQDAAICYSGGEREPRSPCDNNLQCADGSLCFGAGSDFYCLTACTDVDDCAAGEYCSVISTGAGLCRRSVGRACTSDECGDGLVCTTTDDDISPLFPGGYCTLFDCSSDLECAGSAVCRRVPVGEDTRSICLAPCEDRSDCRFNGAYDCVDDAACAASTNIEACRAMLSAGPLCLPGPL